MSVYCSYCHYKFMPDKKDIRFVSWDKDEVAEISCPRCGRTLKVFNPLEQILSERITSWGY